MIIDHIHRLQVIQFFYLKKHIYNIMQNTQNKLSLVKIEF